MGIFLSEEIIENKIVNKDGNIEDPNIVAQRLLNIFRQLHIFSPEKKESFNKMILSQPQAIKNAFSKLLGGAYLKEYIDTLENEEGYIKSAEEIDEIFVETDDGYIKKQSKNINDKQNYNNNINIEELIANITKNQTDLISDLTKIQTAQLAEIISLSLQETYKSTTKSLIDALTSKNVDTKNIEKHIQDISKNVDVDFKNNIEKTKKKLEENPEISKNIVLANVAISKPIEKAPVKEVFPAKKPDEKNDKSAYKEDNNKNLGQNKNKPFEENKNKDKDRTVQSQANQNKQNNRPDVNNNNSNNNNRNKPVFKQQPYSKFMEEVDVQNSDTPINLAGVSISSFDNLLKNDKNNNDDWLWLEDDNIRKESKKSQNQTDNKREDSSKRDNKSFTPRAPVPIVLPKDEADDDYINLDGDDDFDFDLEETIQDNQVINNPQKQNISVPEAEEDSDWEWEYEEVVDDEPATADEDEWEWEYEEVVDDTPSSIDKEAVTFEETPLYPEREKEIKPAPLTSEAIIEKEGMFKFDNFEEVPVKEEPLSVVEIPRETPIINAVQKNPAENILFPISSKDLLKNVIGNKDSVKQNLPTFPENKIVKEKIEELDLNDLIVKEKTEPIKEEVKIEPVPEERPVSNKSLESKIDSFVIDKNNTIDIITTKPEQKRASSFIEELEAIDDKNFIPSSSKELLEIHKNKEKISKELENVKIGLESSFDDENIDNLYK